MYVSLTGGTSSSLAADIWSFGITALELACGRAPNSLYPPAKVLSKTILEESPTLDREGGKYKYSRTMKEMIDSCLVKDPRKRWALRCNLVLLDLQTRMLTSFAAS